MNNKIWAIISIIEAVIICALLAILTKPPVNTPDVITKEIIRDSIIRDSIFIEVEKIKKEIVYVEKQFKQDSIDIMSADDSTLLRSFSRYIEDYNNK